MLEKYWDKLEFSFESISSVSYLTVAVGENPNVKEYQVAMMENNAINCLLPFERKRTNGRTHFYYNITSRLPLDFYLKRKKLRRNECIKLLSDITGALIGCGGYLLDDGGVVLDIGRIYINPSTAEVSLLYLPVAAETDGTQALREVVLDILLKHADIDEYGSDNFLQRILAFVRGEVFSLPGFFQFLGELMVPREAEGIEWEGNQAVAVLDGSAAKLKPVAGSDSRTREVVPERPAGKVGVWIPGIVGIAGLSQILIGLAIVLGRKFLESLSKDVTVTYAAVIMVVLAVDVLLLKKLKARNLISFSREVPNKSEESGANQGTGNSATSPLHGETQQTPYENALPADADRKPTGAGNTVLLCNVRKEHPVLMGKSPCEQAEIVLDKPDFVIGRLEGQVDYICPNKAVGKVHARIERRDGASYLTDLNSVNGTFVNQERLESNKEYEIKNSDHIAFANSEYVFITW